MEVYGSLNKHDFEGCGGEGGFRTALQLIDYITVICTT